MKWHLLEWLCLVVVLVHLSECCYYLWRLKSSLKWLFHRKLEEYNEVSSNCLHLLVPVYDEATVVEASISYFSQFTDQPGVHLYYISTQKEGTNGATIQVLQALAKRYKFTHLHYPFEVGTKAVQLNWASQWIFKHKPVEDFEKTYFGIYDVDSRPEPDIIQAMLCAKNIAYQQPAIYLENYNRIGTFQQVGALLQTKWELSRNMAVLRENYSYYQQKRHMISLPPCTGHGLFLRADLFQKGIIFNTETLTEDLELGYRLAFNNISITPLPIIDICQYAPAPMDTIPQTSRWFSGEANLYHYYHRTKPNLFFTWLVFKRYYLTFKWAFGAPILAIALAVLIIRYPIALVMALLSLLLYIYVPIKCLYRSPLWATYLGGRSNIVTLVLVGIARPLFNSLGPLSYLLTTPLQTLRGKTPVFVKTPKN